MHNTHARNTYYHNYIFRTKTLQLLVKATRMGGTGKYSPYVHIDNIKQRTLVECKPPAKLTMPADISMGLTAVAFISLSSHMPCNTHFSVVANATA